MCIYVHQVVYTAIQSVFKPYSNFIHQSVQPIACSHLSNHCKLDIVKNFKVVERRRTRYEEVNQKANIKKIFLLIVFFVNFRIYDYKQLMQNKRPSRGLFLILLIILAMTTSIIVERCISITEPTIL